MVLELFILSKNVIYWLKYILSELFPSTPKAQFCYVTLEW